MTAEKPRAHYLPPLAAYRLNQACATLYPAFPDGYGIFLVGSCLARRDHRDVDVRCILPDASYDRLFGSNALNSPLDDGEGYRNGLWSVMCVAISTWLSQVSGLPVDFQIQRQTQANADHAGQRNALGIFLEYPGELPSSIGKAIRAEQDRTKGT
jgi:hypothetical protein